MTTKFVALTSAVLLLVSSAVGPSFARDNNPQGEGTTRKSLEDAGYTCSYVATGFWECTKAGETTYWCDVSSCQPKPLTVRPGKGLRLPNANTMLMTQ
ncbi:MAG: hypothetical protein ACYC0C_14830 [Devosia sp.]